MTIWVIWMICLASWAHAETLTIQLNEQDVVEAQAIAYGSKTTAAGMIAEGKIIFNNLLPGEHYDVILRTRPGLELRLVDLSWYTDPAPDETPPEPMSEEDRQAIGDFLTKIKAFTNKNFILQLAGNSRRAVGLLESYRDTDFHARKDDEIIWRIEVWYFENQAGGWAKVGRQVRVIERRRFSTMHDFEARRNALQWIGMESGLKLERGKNSTVNLNAGK